MEYLSLGIIVESIDRQSGKNCHALESGEGLNPKIRVDGLRYQSPVEPHEIHRVQIQGVFGGPVLKNHKRLVTFTNLLIS